MKLEIKSVGERTDGTGLDGKPPRLRGKTGPSADIVHIPVVSLAHTQPDRGCVTCNRS